MKYFNILFVLFSVYLLISCQTENNNLTKEGKIKNFEKPSGFKDFNNDVDHPALNEEMIVNFNGDSIAVYALVAKGKEPKETVILTHGLPGNDKNLDVGQAIRRAGKNVIYFNYRGSWGSQRDFLYSNCLKDVEYLINYLSTEKVANKLRISTNNFAILGRSFGGGIALIQGSKIESVKKIVAISTYNVGFGLDTIHSLSQIDYYERYLDNQVILNVDSKRYLQEILDNKDLFNVVSYAKGISSKKTLLVENNSRNEPWIKDIKGVDYRNLPSDHGFIDKRIALTNLIIEWLFEENKPS